MIAMTITSKRLLHSLLFAIALVAILSVLALLPYLGFFAYPLFPGIGISGLIFSSGIESYHLLRFEVAAVALNIGIYTGLFYLLLAPSHIRRRRTFSEYYRGAPAKPSIEANPAAPAPIHADNTIAEPNAPLFETAEEE
jgi:hypothetical protein